MPAAVAVPLIMGGMSMVGGAIQSHAANSAAKKQQKSADQALALNRDIYNRQSEFMSPYINAGQSSLARLMDGYWNNRPYGAMAPQGQGAVPGVPQVMNANQIGGGAFSQAMGSGSNPGQMSAIQAAQQRTGGPSVPQMAAGTANGKSSIDAPQGPGGGMVAMRAPDGSMAMVPSQHVDRLLQAGGERIG